MKNGDGSDGGYTGLFGLWPWGLFVLIQYVLNNEIIFSGNLCISASQETCRILSRRSHP